MSALRLSQNQKRTIRSYTLVVCHMLAYELRKCGHIARNDDQDVVDLSGHLGALHDLTTALHSPLERCLLAPRSADKRDLNESR